MRSQKRRLFVSLLFSGIAITKVLSQTLPGNTVRIIDDRFAQWNTSASPGYSIGIVRNDSLIYAKGYGMSNLEYGIPNTPATIFHIASLSKQFTAFSIVLLARQGKLKLDDDIHKYLHWFPDLTEKITLRNLLNHTSGIRDQWQLLAISGTGLEDVITQEHIIKILSKQQALNFRPGDEYSYSNSGFTMLAEVIKSVTGQTLRQFTDSAIFKPLGMTSTHFHDDYTEIEKNRAYSYNRIDDTHFTNAILSYSNAGATSLFTNIDDMSKWVMNFYNHTVGDQKDIDQLTQRGRLNNGKELDYALGIVVDDTKGWRRYSHAGADAGFRTSIRIFPGLKMGFIVFSNFDDSNPGRKADEIADLFIKDNAPRSVTGGFGIGDTVKAILRDIPAIKKFSGDYISDDGARFSFKLEDKKMYWHTTDNVYMLVKTDRDTFAVFSHPEIRFVFNISQAKDTLVSEYWPGNKRVLSKYIADSIQTDSQLLAYTGIYYCPELECRYGIALKEHHLVLTNNKYKDTQLTLAGDKHLFDDFWWMSHLVMIKNNKNEIQGFEINSGRIMHLLFKKIE